VTNENEIRSAVKERYGKLAKTPTTKKASCCENAAGCCSGDTRQLSMRAKGYTTQDLEKVPDDAEAVGAGCGNPTALASIEPGQVVLDLGSGGGFDVFIASAKVGPEGKVIGVDATPEMVWRARRTAEEEGYHNVQFRLGEIEQLPVESSTVDLVISNCVINLSPDKDQVFREALRVLKPGGRLAVSDIVTLGEIPEEVKKDLSGWAECVSGAIPEDAYLTKIADAGFADAHVEDQRRLPKEAIEGFLKECLGSTELCGVIDGFDGIASDDIVATKPRS
jgi:SAM-dependent methyltransferase